MSALESEVERLVAAIRQHRDERGDDRCWMDDERLYRALPEGYASPQRGVLVELEMCQKFIECRRHPGTEYVSPQRRIEELEAEVNRLKAEVAEAESTFEECAAVLHAADEVREENRALKERIACLKEVERQLHKRIDAIVGK